MVQPSEHHTRGAAKPAERIVRRARSAIVCLLLLLSHASAQNRATKPQPDTTPAIARIAGIRVGVDTLKTLRTRLGSGAPMTGSRGFVWSWRAAGCVIRATFAVPPGLRNPAEAPPVLDGDVVRTVSLECADGSHRGAQPDCPNVHGYVRELGWIGSVTPGMTRAKLIEATRRLPKCVEHGAEMIWRAAVVPPPGSPLAPSTRWAAVVRFAEGKVASVRVAAQ